ncbi:hypothetical protein [Couchioplanes caeruleus]|uniref:Lipoprotein n=2 Tax=Couchioplanes caeruleus TaxID=56438 RepID=A0A1K0G2W7_9ACTN|nr:hypothetical protein [Couchioplanes caeruleus]OJF11634.1 hypothetical protein BG844_25160 [Couchioplanes caeruleus subsp. caeruleus]ROP31618.1 hypothetical protein EDD30_4539 [Couchioplanes caeruleus]
MVRRIAYCLIAVVLAVSGCADGGGPALPAVSRIPVPSAGVAAPLPLDDYWPSPEQEDTLIRAKRLIADKCMADFGLDLSGLPAFPPSAMTMTRLRRAQLLDETLASRYGYHYDRYPEAPTQDGPGDRSSGGPAQRPDPAAVQVFLGRTREYGGRAVPAGGCRDRAEGELTRGAPWPDPQPGPEGVLSMRDEVSLENFLLGLRYQAYESALRDPRLEEAADRWSSCMARSGYRYPHPAAAVEDKRWDTDGKDITRPETDAATTDVRCRVTVNYLGIQEALQAAYETRLVGEHAEPLRLMKQNLEIRLRNAATAPEPAPEPRRHGA